MASTPSADASASIGGNGAILACASMIGAHMHRCGRGRDHR
ncbi:hypothetical protein AZ78_5087 [Lysobacter capsici AZ78]|uniref:Uncharacterized protein n=1 Tax=Lysobacter capsici AZ78 TaxID=1444315 RepID=A0A125U065_9GAMM|nr:hypothetical protein AZ78_5087 [Lysobacter capsici AZ78]